MGNRSSDTLANRTIKRDTIPKYCGYKEKKLGIAKRTNGYGHTQSDQRDEQGDHEDVNGRVFDDLQRSAYVSRSTFEARNVCTNNPSSLPLLFR